MNKRDLKKQKYLENKIKELNDIIQEQEKVIQEKDEEIEKLKLQLSGQELSTPSSQKLPKDKKNKPKKRRKKRGRKKGHVGSRRSKPEHIDNVKEWDTETCPDCGGNLCEKICETKIRYVEDINLASSEVTEEKVNRRFCPKCNKIITPPMTDALPKSQIGIITLIVSAWQHYYVGISLNKLVELFSFTHFLNITNGYLIQAWKRLAIILIYYYNYIQICIQKSKYIHIDETGWRVYGINHWLWAFSNKTFVFFSINKTRGSTAIKEILGEFFNGCIISDFWTAYNKIEAAAKQKCLVHLLRELKKISLRNFSEEWCGFYKKIRRLLADAIRLSIAKQDLEKNVFNAKRKRLDIRLELICKQNYQDKDILRIVKRWLIKYKDHFFTFIDLDCPKDNNHNELMIRNAVLLRKMSGGSQSLSGAKVSAIFLTVFGTLKLNNINPVLFLIDALKQYIATGKLPDLPINSNAMNNN